MKKLFILYVFMCAWALSKAQEIPKVISPSPITQAFLRYGEYPVSHYTGIPDIKIPIYTIQTGDITVPIYLSYHASGTRVDDLKEAGYIGLGWTLQTGGLISRELRALPDMGFIGNVQNGFPDYTLQYNEMKEIEEGDVDNEYDIWSYSFLGRSGKFIPYNTTEDWIAEKPFLFKHEDLRMDINSDMDQQEIIDENGRSFLFGTVDGAREYVRYNNWQSATVTWHLNGIHSARYPEAGVGYQYQLAPRITLFPTNQLYTLEDWQGIPSDSYFFQYTLNSGNNYSDNTKTVSYDPCVPKRITFPSGYILFHLNGRVMDKIEIFDQHNNLVKTVSLVIGTFNSSYPIPIPKLKEVIFKGADGSPGETYSFSYNSEDYTMYATRPGKDHWGYLNSSVNNDSYIMPFTLLLSQGTVGGTFTVGGQADRSVSEQHTKLYTLERITYPTKGYTIFEFEGNKDGLNHRVGGLRVKTISSYTGTGELASQKQYAYHTGMNEVQVGGDMYRTDASHITNELFEAHRMYFSEHSNVNLFPKGAPIGYYEVTETMGAQITTYMFDNDDAYTYDYLNFPGYLVDGSGHKYPRLIHHYKPWGYGNLWCKIIKGPGFEQTEIYNYEEFVRDTMIDLAFKRVVTIGCVYLPGTFCRYSESSLVHNSYRQSSVYNFAQRYHLSGCKRLKNKSVWQKGSDGREVKSYTTYYYDNPEYLMQVSRQTTENSKGEVLTTEFKYANDLGASAPYNVMVERNMVALPVKQLDYVNSQHARTTFTKYKEWNSNWGPFFAPEEIEIEKSGKTYSAAKFYNYDLAGNILAMSKGEDRKASYLWDYKNTLAIAECLNADGNTIAYTSFEADGKGNWEFSGTPAPELTAPTGKKAYQFNGSNAISKTGLQSTTEYILSYWTSNASAFTIAGTKPGYPVPGREVTGWKYYEHRITGQTQVTINGAGWIDELRLYPSNAQMTTYTHAPIIGTTSVCDINNVIKYYEYDPAGRLSIVRDQDKNVLQRMCYNYAGQPVNCGGGLYYSNAVCQTFVKNNCGVDQVADPVMYCVPASQYNSTESQAAADALAFVDLQANGQNLANASTCRQIYFNVEKSGNFTRNDCLNDVLGSTVTYTVPARWFMSFEGQAAADAMAEARVRDYGQWYANQNGTCSFYGNNELSDNFYSQNCEYGYAPNPVPVFVAANTFISAVSQQDANNMAYNHAVDYANQENSCYLYHDVELTLDKWSEIHDWIIELQNEDTDEIFFFEVDDESDEVLGNVPSGEYMVTISSGYVARYFRFKIGCENWEGNTEGILLYDQELTPTCNKITIEDVW